MMFMAVALTKTAKCQPEDELFAAARLAFTEMLAGTTTCADLSPFSETSPKAAKRWPYARQRTGRQGGKCLDGTGVAGTGPRPARCYAATRIESPLACGLYCTSA